ncbi:MAG: PAS domain S-box protein, partial [Balneolaceae bacterium]
MNIGDPYRALFNHSLAALFITRPDGAILEANQTACDLFGYSVEEFRTLGRRGIIDPDSPGLQEKLKERLETGKASGELVAVRKDGRRILCEFSSVLFQGDDGERLSSVMLIDITEREESKERLKTVAKNIPGVVFRYKRYPDGRDSLLYVSEGARQVWSLSAEEVMEDNERVWSLYHPEDLEEHLRTIQESAEALSPWMHEWRIRHPDGSTRWNRGVGNPTRMNDGSTVWDSIILDVTTEKEAQKRLKETESRLRNIVEYSTNMFYSHDLKGRLTYVSPQSVDFLGYRFDEKTPLWTDYLTDHPVNRLGAEYTEKALSTGQRQPPYELELERLDGARIWVEVNEAPVVKDGKVIEMVGSLTDITDRKQAERESEQNRKLLRELTDQASAAIWVRNEEGVHVFTNREFRALFGLENEQVDGKSIDDLFDADLARQFRENDRRVLETGSPSVFEETFATEDRILYYRSNIFLLRDIPGRSRLVGGVAIDTTEQKETEEFIRNSLLEKNTLLAEIHHRVKNNLAVVSSLLEMQAMNSENEDLKFHLRKAILRINSMAAIHEQLYQTDSFSKFPFREGLQVLVERVAEAFQDVLALDVTYDLEPIELNINQAVPSSLLVNEVLTNILKHSFHGKKSGSIFIRLNEKDNVVTLRIEDDG